MAYDLLLRQSFTVHQVMSFLGKTMFCGNGHVQLHWLCHVIRSDMLNVYHSPAHLILSFHLSLSLQCQLQRLSQLLQSLAPLQFPFPLVVSNTDANPIIGPFIFRVLGFLYAVVAPGLVPYVRCIFLCKNFKPVALMLHKMAFQLSGKVVALQ